MKKISTLVALETIGLLVALLVSIIAGAQAPLYKFKNPVLISGTAGQINAVYRFSNVYTSGTNTDALVKIQNKVGNITLSNIDRNADGYNEAFQPEYSVGALSNAYIDFQITFVQGGTSTPVSQPSVDVSGLDIDGFDTLGYTLKEFNKIDMGGGVCSFNLLGSQLVVSKIGTAFEADNITGILFGALVDTISKQVMYSVTNVNVASFTYRVGSNNLLPAAMTRYASLYFKKFNYPQNVILAVNDLASFSGTTANNKRDLKWALSDGNNVANIVLEKSASGNSFQDLATFSNSRGVSQKEFYYTDTKNADELAYYRLKMVTNEGKVEYSNTLRFATDKNTTGQLAVYPTIVQSTATLNYNSGEKQTAVIAISDMSGRTVKQQNVLLQEGSNSFQVSGFDQYSKGSYIVSVLASGKRISKQVIVQ